MSKIKIFGFIISVIAILISLGLVNFKFVSASRERSPIPQEVFLPQIKDVKQSSKPSQNLAEDMPLITNALSADSDNTGSDSNAESGSGRKLSSNCIPSIDSASYIDPAMVNPGDSFTAHYKIYNPCSYSLYVGLGISIRKTGSYNEIYDTTHDTVVMVPSGWSWRTRLFTTRSDIQPGDYEYILGIWADWPGSSTWYDGTPWRPGPTIISLSSINSASFKFTSNNSGYLTINKGQSVDITATVNYSIGQSGTLQVWIYDNNFNISTKHWFSPSLGNHNFENIYLTIPASQTNTITTYGLNAYIQFRANWYGEITSTNINDIVWGQADTGLRLKIQDIANNPPTLSGVYVDPSNGNKNTTFTFWVTYKDADNDPPVKARLRLNNSSVYNEYDLSKWNQNDNNYTDGALYYKQLNLERGRYDFSFTFNDGKQSHTDVVSGQSGVPNVVNRPPNQPYDGGPNGVCITNLNTTLNWRGSDPDGDSIKYKVYFGTNSNPPYVGTTDWNVASYNPGNLTYNTTYYWKVEAIDSYDSSSTMGPLWNFSTPPLIISPLINFNLNDVNKNTKKISGTAQAVGSLYINNVKVFIDGIERYNYLNPNLGGGGTISQFLAFDWNWQATSSEILAGKHIIVVKAYDNKGLEGTSSKETEFAKIYELEVRDIQQQWTPIRSNSIMGGYALATRGNTEKGQSLPNGMVQIKIKNNGNVKTNYRISSTDQFILSEQDDFEGTFKNNSSWKIYFTESAALSPFKENSLDFSVDPDQEKGISLYPIVPYGFEEGTKINIFFRINNLDSSTTSKTTNIVYTIVSDSDYGSSNLNALAGDIQNAVTGLYNFFIGDDIATLTDDQAQWYERLISGGFLLTMVVPEEKVLVVIKSVGTGGVKSSEKIAAKTIEDLSKTEGLSAAKRGLARAELEESVKNNVKKWLGRDEGEKFIGKLSAKNKELLLRAVAGDRFSTNLERFIKNTNKFKEANGFDRFMVQALGGGSADGWFFASDRIAQISDDLIKDGFKISDSIYLEKSFAGGELDAFIIKRAPSGEVKYELREFKSKAEGILSERDIDSHLGQISKYQMLIREGWEGTSLKNAKIIYEVKQFNPDLERMILKKFPGVRLDVEVKSGGYIALLFVPYLAPVITTNSGKDLVTDSQDLVLEGTCDTGAEKIFVNGSQDNVLYSTGSGAWVYKSILPKGVYKFEIISVDSSGAISEPSIIWVTIDPPPVITTNNGQNFFTSNPNLILNGTAETFFARVLVNGLPDGVIFDSDAGIWSYSTVLHTGPNTFEINAETPSGILSDSAKITVTFYPQVQGFTITNYWQMFSVTSEITNLSIFGSADIRRYNSATNQYEKVSDKLIPSEGYWIKGNSIKTVDLPDLGLDINQYASFNEGFVLFSGYFLQYPDKLKLNSNGQVKNLKEAIDAGWLKGKAYFWNNDHYEYLDISQGFQIDQIRNKSFWLRLYTPITFSFDGRVTPESSTRAVNEIPLVPK